jgi:GntR family transcriptional regulator/MocR family aminotransferase
MEEVPFCEEVHYVAKHPPSLRMPSIALECFSGPLHRRLFLALSQQILSSDFQNGDRLPSTRALAKELGISRNTVVSAYDKLSEDSYTISKVGSGTQVVLTLTRMSRPATKPGEGTRGGLSLTGVLRRSHYPVRSATFQDRDGNALYLFAAV